MGYHAPLDAVGHHRQQVDTQRSSSHETLERGLCHGALLFFLPVSPSAALLYRNWLMRFSRASADWVILMTPVHVVPGKPTNPVLIGLDWWPRDEVLRRAGFKRVAFKTTSDPLYQLWQKER